MGHYDFQYSEETDADESEQFTMVELADGRWQYVPVESLEALCLTS